MSLKLHLRSLISKRSISKNTKMELTSDSYIKFNVESVPGVHSSQNSFLPLQNEFEFCNLDWNAVSPIKFVSKFNNSRCLKNRSIFLFFLNKPILQLEMYEFPNVFSTIFHKKNGKHISKCYTMLSPSISLFWYFSLQSFVINAKYLDLNIAF